MGIGLYLDFPSRARNGEHGLRILELSTIGLPWLLNLKKTNAGHVFKRNLNRFLALLLRFYATHFNISVSDF